MPGRMTDVGFSPSATLGGAVYFISLSAFEERQDLVIERMRCPIRRLRLSD